MAKCFPFVFVLTLTFASGIMLEEVFTRSDPTMQDVLEISKNAKVLGEIYNAKAKTAPTETEEQAMLKMENAKTISSVDEAIAAEIEGNAALNQCAGCSREYSATCPKSWDEVSEGMCIAPKSYGGPCQGVAYFSEMSTTDKQHFEKRCGSCWPCSANAAGSSSPPSGPVR